MLGHLGVNVQHLAQAKAYYDSLMPLLEFEPYLSAADQFAYRPAGGKPGTYLNGIKLVRIDIIGQ